ncbi:MAG: DUF169 domain-containing protein [Bryobacteraceae bacterium]
MTQTSPRVQELLPGARAPIAIGFLDEVPAGLKKWDSGGVPAGCAFWKLAMDGRSFYTVPSDHFNCAVGSYTHGIALPPERGAQLQDTIGFMIANRYLEMAEVPGIPVLPKAPAYVAYAPAEAAPFQADVVVIAADPATAMLVYEAALRAGAGSALASALGRPGCAVLPLTRNSGTAAVSFGCKGNRTFTGLPDSQMYLCIPGGKWDAVVRELAVVRQANRAMGEYYAGQKEKFPIV